MGIRRIPEKIIKNSIKGFRWGIESSVRVNSITVAIRGRSSNLISRFIF